MSGKGEAERLARAFVWWQDPETTLASPRKLLCQILRFGRAEDYLCAERIWGREALKDALLQARRGEIDSRSENFWRLRFSIEGPRS